MAEKPDLSKHTLRHVIIGIVLEQSGLTFDELLDDSNGKERVKAIKIADEVLELLEKVNIIE